MSKVDEMIKTQLNHMRLILKAPSKGYDGMHTMKFVSLSETSSYAFLSCRKIFIEETIQKGTQRIETEGLMITSDNE